MHAFQNKILAIFFLGIYGISIQQMPIPDFDHNLVIPPHGGDPTTLDVSPYTCDTLELCQKLGFSPVRRRILLGFLDFRDRLRTEGLTQAFHWLDGSFLEHKEMRSVPSNPADLDLVTFCWGYDIPFLMNLVRNMPEFLDRTISKTNFHLDHFPVDIGNLDPAALVATVQYWSQLFSHNRDGVWKGMLRVELNTPAKDAAARNHLLTSVP